MKKLPKAKMRVRYLHYSSEAAESQKPLTVELYPPLRSLLLFFFLLLFISPSPGLSPSLSLRVRRYEFCFSRVAVVIRDRNPSQPSGVAGAHCLYMKQIKTPTATASSTVIASRGTCGRYQVLY